MADALSGLTLPEGVTLTHLQPTIGTEVAGLDLRAELDAATVAFLRALWLKRKVLLFRDQPLSEDEHIRFGQYFGPLDALPRPAGADQSWPELLVIKRDGSDNSENEAFFHQDVPYANPPVAGAIAIMKKCPGLGGDTIIADMVAAYDRLSPWLKVAIEDMQGIHRFDLGIVLHNANVTEELIAKFMQKYPPKTYPLVQTHRETGEKVLYVSQSYTHAIKGLPRDESYALIKLLSDRARVPENQCRVSWRENTVVMWDNRSTQHYAAFDYPGHFRHLQRVTVLDTEAWPGTSL